MKKNSHLIKGNNTGTGKTIGKWVALGAAALIIVVLVIVAVTRKNTQLYARSASLDSLRSYEASYAKYLEEYGFDGTLSSARIDIDLEKFETAGELEAVKGETGLITENDGSISWKFKVQESGFYNLKMHNPRFYSHFLELLTI